MKHSKWFLLMVCGMGLTALVGACAPFQSESHWGPAHQLSGLGATYAWRQGAKCEPESVQTENPDIPVRVQEQLEADLATKGYLRPAGGKPDFVVCYRLGKVVTQAETGLDSWDDAVLEVDLTDPATGGLIWRGRVRGRIDYSASPDARGGRLDTAVRQLMKPLPKASNR